MFTINISFKVDNNHIQEWKQWMQEETIPMTKDHVEGSDLTFYSLLENRDDQGETFVVQIRVKDRAVVENYLKKYQGVLHQSIYNKWRDKALFFETILQEII